MDFLRGGAGGKENLSLPLSSCDPCAAAAFDWLIENDPSPERWRTCGFDLGAGPDSGRKRPVVDHGGMRGACVRRGWRRIEVPLGRDSCLRGS